MAFVVTDACINCKHTDCVEVCPVDCFYEGDNFIVINPEECIDCGLCEPACPVKAIYAEDELPPDQIPFVEINDNLSRKWPNLTQKKDAMPEAEKYAEIKNKIGMLKETKFKWTKTAGIEPRINPENKTLIWCSFFSNLFAIWVGTIKNAKSIPIINGKRARISKFFTPDMISWYTPRINNTNEPDIPGNIKAVKAKRPVKISKKLLLKLNWRSEKAIRIAMIIPKAKLRKYFAESEKLWSIEQFFITANIITSDRNILKK